MSTSHRVFVVSGPIGHGRLDERSREKLRHARLSSGSDLVSPAARLARRLGVDEALLSKASTRYRGEQGRVTEGWIAAADPVYLEARLDHLCLMAQVIDETERLALAEHLNQSLGGDGLTFLVEGDGIYIQAEPAIASSQYPTSVIDGLLPNKYLPEGAGADEFRTLLAEIEMSLHEHPLNDARQARGQKPVNSLWLWGGGTASESPSQSLPPLYSRDPTLRGLWSMHGAESREPTAQLPSDGTSCVLDIGDDLGILTRLLDSGRPLSLYSRDGFTVDDTGKGRWRFWARRHTALEPPS